MATKGVLGMSWPLLLWCWVAPLAWEGSPHPAPISLHAKTPNQQVSSEHNNQKNSRLCSSNWTSFGWRQWGSNLLVLRAALGWSLHRHHQKVLKTFKVQFLQGKIPSPRFDYNKWPTFFSATKVNILCSSLMGKFCCDHRWYITNTETCPSRWMRKKCGCSFFFLFFFSGNSLGGGTDDWAGENCKKKL